MAVRISGRVVSFNAGHRISITEETVAAPGERQLLVQMKACGICQYDIKSYKDPGVNPVYSARPGHEGVGIVHAVGKGVEGLKPGDKVTSNVFGGSLSDYFIAEIDTVVKIPDEVERYELWISEPAACVVNSLRFLGIEPGDDVVLIGSGYMGLLFIQSLPMEFINNFVVIDIDDDRLALTESLGAVQTINSLRVDAAEAVRDILEGGADLVIEAVGLPGVLGQATDMLRNGGRLCIFGHHVQDEVLPTSEWHMKGLHILNTTPFTSMNFHRDLEDAVKLIKKKVFDQSALVSRTYSYEDFEAGMEEVSHRPSRLIKTALVNY